eukprot:1379498-Amorphochlora_amoeboformis.AAC.1
MPKAVWNGVTIAETKEFETVEGNVRHFFWERERKKERGEEGRERARDREVEGDAQLDLFQL